MDRVFTNGATCCQSFSPECTVTPNQDKRSSPALINVPAIRANAQEARPLAAQARKATVDLDPGNEKAKTLISKMEEDAP